MICKTLENGWCPQCKMDTDLRATYKVDPPRWDVSCPLCDSLLKRDLLCSGPDDVPPWGVVLISEEPLTEADIKRAHELIEEHGWDVYTEEDLEKMKQGSSVTFEELFGDV